MLQHISKARSCFEEIYFASANIPKELDYYGDGTIMMFYRLFRREEWKEKYEYIFYMETDVFPIQKNWAEALWLHTRSVEPFWQKGNNLYNLFLWQEEWSVQRTFWIEAGDLIIISMEMRFTEWEIVVSKIL